MLTFSNTASLLGKFVALMVTELGDTMMKILVSSVSETKSPGNFQSLNKLSSHVNTFVNSAVNSTQGSNVADQTKVRLVLDQQVTTTIQFEKLLQELPYYDTALLQFLVHGFQRLAALSSILCYQHPSFCQEKPYCSL